MKPEKNTRLTVDVPAEWLKELKMAALKYNVTLKQLINTMILDRLHKERDLDKD